VLKVPSAVIEHEWNYVLNPLHPDFSKIRWDAPRKFAFDPRLFK
jgi:RES domain-containing protein